MPAEQKGPAPATPSPFEALTPLEMAQKGSLIGTRKAQTGIVPTFVLAVLAGAFIAFGAISAIGVATVVPGAEGLPWGITKLLMGMVFSLGLILVVVGGAELYTGNTLLVISWASQRISLGSVLRNWAIVFPGNFVGAFGIALMLLVAGEWHAAAGGFGLTALTIAQVKGHLGFGEALVLGILCNILVCLAVWLTYSARTTTDRILALVPPVAAFVAAGFEHSVANMFFIPFAVLVKTFAPDSFWTSIGQTPAAFPDVTWAAFIGNLVPVTIGNIIGGGVFVGAVYWLIYIRHGHEHGQPAATAVRGQVADAGQRA
jgi:formate transporter FocA